MSQQINLLNPSLIKQKDPVNAAMMLMAAGGIVLGMLVLAAWSNYRLSQLTKTQQAAATQLASLKLRLDAAVRSHAPRQPSKALQETLNLTAVRLDNRQKLLAYLQGGESGSRTGYSAYMQAFSARSVKGLWLTELAIDDAAGQIKIAGRALQPDVVPQYIAGLGLDPLLKGREFSALQMQTLGSAADAKKGAVTPAVTEFKLQTIEHVSTVNPGSTPALSEKKS